MAPSSYGHDSHGVNIQNLRSLNASKSVLPGGFRTEDDWKQETHEAMVLAENEKTMSKSLRDASRKLEEDLKIKVETDECLVEQALRHRIAKTTEIKGLVEAAIDNTDAERGNVELTLKKLQNRANNIRKKINIAEGRVQRRQERPVREMVNDTLQLQLKKQNLLLQCYLSEIESRAKAADNNIQRLERVRRTLQKDLDAKAKALEIDQKVLEGDIQDRTSRDAEFATASVQPHQWTRATENAIKEANSLARETERFRQESSKMIKNNEEKRKTFSAMLNTTMLEKLNETESLKYQLESKLDEILKEIESAKARKQALEASLHEKKQPMERAARRLAMRTRRPSHECVNDEAHKALVSELRHITAVTNALKSKIASVDHQIRQLELQRDTIKDNIKDKQLSWKVDEGMAMLDGRVALPHAPMSVWSSASSVRSVGSRRSSLSRASSTQTHKSEILGRISKLEADVATARNERIALEERVADLKKT